MLILAGILLIISNYLYIPYEYIEDKSPGIEYDDLRIKLNLDKENYTFGETINASIKIINNNEVNITSNLIFYITSLDWENLVKSTKSQRTVLFYDETLVTVDAYSEKTVIKNYIIPMDVSSDFRFESYVSFVNKGDGKFFDVKPLFDVVVDFPKDVDIYEIFNVSLEVINNCDEDINNIIINFKVLKGNNLIKSFMESVDKLFGGSSVILNWSLFIEDDYDYKLRFDIDSDDGGNDVFIYWFEVWDFYQISVDVNISSLIVETGSTLNVSSIISNIGYKPLYNLEVELWLPLYSVFPTSDPLIKNIDVLHPEIPVVINWTLNVNKTGNYVVFVTAIDESKNCVGEGAADIQVVDELSY